MHTQQPIPIPTDADMAENIRAVNALLRRRGWTLTQPAFSDETLERWGRALAAKRTWDSPEALAEYLDAQSFYWTGHAPTPEERAVYAAMARTIWADAESERVVPSASAPGVRTSTNMSVCAWASCRRTFPEGTGFGTLCSKKCFTDEAEAGTVDAERVVPS